MIYPANQSGFGIAMMSAATVAVSWPAAAAMLLAMLMLALYLREHRLRRADREQETRRRDREMGALNAMAAISRRTFELSEILRDTAQWTRELFDLHCDILLFDLVSGAVTHSESTREAGSAEAGSARRKAEQELGAYMERAGRELVAGEELLRLPQPVQSWIAGCGYQSFFAVALHAHGKVIGVMVATSPGPRRFSGSDCDLAMAIARQLGNSVEKVLFYEETELAYHNLRSAQEQLLQSEKMSALGQLIAGVAHELNNPLTAILGYAQLLESEAIGEQAQDFVRKLFRQTQRTHRVVQNLLSFSRQRKPIQSQVDLRRVLDDTLALRESDLKLNNIQVEIHYDPAVPFITGDAHQLEQVFLNIINNAVDSIMDVGKGGTLQVRIHSEANAAEERVCVEFRDSGTGLKDPGKIFDPFYTTKKIGKGSGLGLSICYGIVKEHGGDILAYNHEKGGAVLQLKLPVSGSMKSPAAAELTRPAE